MVRRGIFINLLFLMLLHGVDSELSGLLAILQYFGFFSYNTTSEIWGLSHTIPGQSRGVCQYGFSEYALQDMYYCNIDDKYILHIKESTNKLSDRKPPIRVKCLQHNISSNNSLAKNTLMVMQNSKEIINLLKPIGNASKRLDYGSCVVVLFCTSSSLACSTIASSANMLPRLYPTLRFAYIDSYKFPSFNAEFGVVGLPTLLLFHQGRPVIKYFAGDKSYMNFVTIYTGLKPIPKVDERGNMGPLSLVPIYETDYCLIIAWGFILICISSYLRRTFLWTEIIEMIKRNWRESEETQMEEN